MRERAGTRHAGPYSWDGIARRTLALTSRLLHGGSCAMRTALELGFWSWRSAWISLDPQRLCDRAGAAAGLLALPAPRRAPLPPAALRAVDDHSPPTIEGAVIRPQCAKSCVWTIRAIGRDDRRLRRCRRRHRPQGSKRRARLRPRAATGRKDPRADHAGAGRGRENIVASPNANCDVEWAPSSCWSPPSTIRSSAIRMRAVALRAGAGQHGAANRRALWPFRAARARARVAARSITDGNGPILRDAADSYICRRPDSGPRPSFPSNGQRAAARRLRPGRTRPRKMGFPRLDGESRASAGARHDLANTDAWRDALPREAIRRLRVATSHHRVLRYCTQGLHVLALAPTSRCAPAAPGALRGPLALQLASSAQQPSRALCTCAAADRALLRLSTPRRQAPACGTG